MSFHRYLLVVIVAVRLVPVAGQDTQPVAEDGAMTPSPPPLYVIQPEDVLEIFVWKEPALSREVLVRPDGRISVPLVQDLIAAGLTPSELKTDLEQLLVEFVTSPNVTVIVKQIQHYRIYVTGMVQKPGSISSPEPLTVLQAISEAGGFQEYANKSAISVVRKVGHDHVISPFDWGEVIKGKKTNQNILLTSGDVVVVP